MSQQLLLASGSPNAPTYVDDVFVSYLRNGTGASTTVTTGLDLSTKGGLAITKARSAATGWRFTDTARGVTKSLDSSSTAAQATDTNGLTAFGTTGHTIGSDTNYNNSTGPVTYVDFVFRKAPKFFDVVTYTGDGVAGRTVAHNLGSVPGMIIVKEYGAAGNNWFVYHRSLGNTDALILNLTNATSATGAWNNTSPTSTNFTLGSSVALNGNGQTYVAYLYAHDTTTDGLIQCGSFTTDGSGNATVTLGWEPQFLLTKRSDSTTNWYASDMMRGMPVGTSPQTLNPNSSAAENTTSNIYSPTATGFTVATGGAGLFASATFIYLAIRRPNKPPTSGTQVYNANYLGNGNDTTRNVTGVGFAPDLFLSKSRNSTPGFYWFDRLRGVNKPVVSSDTTAEASPTDLLMAFGMDGVTLGADASVFATNNSGKQYMEHFFRRAPGVFDVVCFTGTSGNTAYTHNLGATPEFYFVKRRDNISNWIVYHKDLNSGYGLFLNDVAAQTASLIPANPTSTTFTFSGALNSTWVAYLFATKAGISKVFLYTGNGSSQTINCGFSTGARFVLIKRTDSTGNWIVADTTRGLVASSDPALYLNSTAAEITGVDWIDPDNSGFTIVQESTMNANVNGATYIGLALS